MKMRDWIDAYVMLDDVGSGEQLSKYIEYVMEVELPEAFVMSVIMSDDPNALDRNIMVLRQYILDQQSFVGRCWLKCCVFMRRHLGW